MSDASTADTEVSPQDQKLQIYEIISSTKVELGQTWYFISQDWWDDWKKYTRYDALSSRYSGEWPRPGRITNLSILDNNGSLRRGLSQTAHFYMVPEKAWELLDSWYGGTPVARKTICPSGHPFVEVHFRRVILIYKLEEQEVLVSQVLLLKDLRELARRTFSIPDGDEIKLRFPLRSYLDDEMTISSNGIYENDKIYVDLRGDSNNDEAKDSPYDKHYSHSSYKSTTRGLTGLGNLGNTCFMNSSLQCLSNSIPLRDYFISGTFYAEINFTNALGTKGQLAQTFAKLLRNMWDGSSSYCAPRDFKVTLGRHAEQFLGFEQHDSQELIAYLLDGLHEDVNRVASKPFVEQVEAKEGETDAQTATRAWEGHLMRNCSHIVDCFQGQFKSVVTCPEPGCGRVSTTFDPFMYLSVPLPFSDERVISVTFIPMGGILPMRFSIRISKTTSVKNLVKAALTKVRDAPLDDTQPLDVCVADVYNSEIWEIFDLTKNLTDVPENVNVNIYELGPALGAAEPPPKPDMAWVSEFKKYVYSSASFTTAMMSPATEMYSIEYKLKQATELVNSLARATDDIDVRTICRSHYSFDNVNTLQDKDAFVASVEGFRKWHKWFVSDFGSEFLPVMFYADMTRTIQDYYYGSRVHRTFEQVCWPVLVRYRAGVTTLADVLDELAQRCHRFIYKKKPKTAAAAAAAEQSEEDDVAVPSDRSDEDATASGAAPMEAADTTPEPTVEERIRFTRQVLERCAAIVEQKKRYSTPDREYLKRACESEDEVPTDESNVLNTPLSEWLSKGCRLIIGWNEALRNAYLDTDEADRLDSSHDQAEDPKRGKANVHLNDCIRCFMHKEQLEETEMWYCNRCKEHRQAWKQFFLWKTPPILVIHLKRFQYDGMYRDKLDKLVEFPLEGLDLTSHVLDPEVRDQAIYDLYAVSNHYGGMGGGHYTAYCKNSETGGWYEFDDSSVRETTPESVVTSAGYVLFYMRRDLFPARIRVQSTPSPVAAPAPTDVEAGTSSDAVSSGTVVVEDGWVRVDSEQKEELPPMDPSPATVDVTIPSPPVENTEEKSEASSAAPTTATPATAAPAVELTIDELLALGDQAYDRFKVERAAEIPPPVVEDPYKKKSGGYSSSGGYYSSSQYNSNYYNSLSDDYSKTGYV